VTIASRTPEGEPQRCPVCDNVSRLEPSFPGGDACCPTCGHLLLVVRDRVSDALGKILEKFSLSTSLSDAALDSMDIVELVMELEEKFEIDVTDAAAERINTVGDLLRYLRRKGQWPE
jgi:acyl carrier protein